MTLPSQETDPLFHNPQEKCKQKGNVPLTEMTEDRKREATKGSGNSYVSHQPVNKKKSAV